MTDFHYDNDYKNRIQYVKIMTPEASNTVRTMKDRPIRIAILLGSPLTQNIFNRIGASYLSETFDVTIIDCTNWVRVGIAGLKYEKYSYNNVITIMGESDFQTTISTVKPMYAIDFIGKGPYTRTIQNVLKLANIKYVAQRITPSPLPNRALRSQFMSFVNSVSIFRRIFNWLLRFTNNNPLSPDIALLAGLKTRDYWTSSSKVILWTGSTDYFTLKELKRTREISGGTTNNKINRYVLFIDDCLSLSSDYKITGQSRPIEPNEYFEMLLPTFANIEKILSIPVIIAAHPSGKEIPNYASFFGGRAVYFNATAELALDCEIALTHYSTAVAYPVMLKKPIVILNAKRFKNTIQGNFIDNMHNLLNCAVLFMESNITCCKDIITRATLIDEKAYDDYEKSYIANGYIFDTHPFQVFVRFATGC